MKLLLPVLLDELLSGLRARAWVINELAGNIGNTQRLGGIPGRGGRLSNVQLTCCTPLGSHSYHKREIGGGASRARCGPRTLEPSRGSPCSLTTDVRG